MGEGEGGGRGGGRLGRRTCAALILFTLIFVITISISRQSVKEYGDVNFHMLALQSAKLQDDVSSHTLPPQGWSVSPILSEELHKGYGNGDSDSADDDDNNKDERSALKYNMTSYVLNGNRDGSVNTEQWSRAKHPNHPDLQTKMTHSQCVLLRVHNPPEENARRWNRYLEQSSIQGFQNFVLAHETDSAMITAINESYTTIVHQTTEEVKMMYGKHFFDDVPDVNWKKSAWCMHVEFINQWFQTKNPACDFVWIFENDVVWSGDFGDLIQQFNESREDFISSYYRNSEGWPHTDQASNQFKERWPKEVRFIHQEFVLRVLKRLLNTLHNFSSSGITAWSEQFTPTACLAEDNCTSKQLSDDLKGDVFRWNGRVKQEDFLEPNRLYHSAKEWRRL